MKTPPLLIGAGLLFWGFQTGWLMFALPMAVLFEVSHWSRVRWEMSDADLHRIWDLCALLFVGAIVLRYTSDEQLTASAYQFFQWFPFIFLPMALAQAYSNREKVPVSVFSWFMRRQTIDPRRPRTCVDVSYAYLAACILSASAANRRDIWFFVGVTTLIGWALWVNRPRPFPTRVWMASVVVWIGLGYGGQLAVHRLHNVVEGRMTAWFSELLRGRFDPRESRTSLGTIGIRKQSGRIVMRIEAGEGRMESLLREASYDNFRERDWFNTRHSMGEVSPEADATTWTFQPQANATNSFTIFTSLSRRMGTIPVAHGTVRISNLPVATVQTNALGVVRVTDPPGLVGYTIQYDPRQPVDSVPDEALDLHVPEVERPALELIAAEIGLENLSDSEKIEAVQRFFAREFDYSLYVPENVYDSKRGGTRLSHFLLQTRKGHCEYFATATVLLLRVAGIPARYATGYSVQESNGSTYIVRERHAHAWTLVWRNGRWRNVDTTPSSWIESEAAQASVLEFIADAWSAARFHFLKWRWLSRTNLMQRTAPWLLGPMILLLVWRILGRKRTAHYAAETAPVRTSPMLGMDSEFYLIERQLRETAGERAAGESLRKWLSRLGFVEDGGSGSSVEEAVDLHRLLELHYRHRFDPDGLSPAERQNLSNGVARWLEGHSTVVRAVGNGD